MNKIYNQERDKIRKIIREDCVYKPKHGLMFGKLPGTRYASQFYLNNALLNHHFLKSVGYCFGEICKLEYFPKEFQIAGTESAWPLLTHLPQHYYNHYQTDLNAFLIKKENKKYGKHNIIEGKPNPDLPVLVVDPLCNSTGAFVHCDRVLNFFGFQTLDFCFAILNKYPKTEENWMHDRYSGQQCFTILTRDEL